MDKIIQTRGLKKAFPVKSGLYEAVRGLDLDVFAGEIFGFLGPNGAGKTTTLRMLTTLLPIDRGEATIAGFDVRNDSQNVRKHIGYVSQKGGADAHATGRENLLLQGRLYGMSVAEAKIQADRLLAQFSLTEHADRFVSIYSGGQQRRLDLCLGMMHQPKVLFLDEPTTGLDPQNRANLWDQLKTLKKEGITIFITSHYLDEIDFLSDRLAIIDQGKVVAIGSSKELKKEIAGDVVTIGIPQEKLSHACRLFEKKPYIREVASFDQNLRLYVDQGEKSLSEILRILDAEKLSFESLSISVPTLNDVFLKKTGHALREGEGKS